MKTLLTMIFLVLTIISLGQKAKRKSVKIIPQLTIYNINGDTTNLKIVSSNKVTFIDFWFIPCGPCFVEMNMLHKLYAKYMNNPNVAFLTITLTDSAFVRPLIENRNTFTNQTYDYFKTLALVDTFKLPVYFAKGAILKMVSLKKSKAGFSGRSAPETKEIDIAQSPDSIFGFIGYPTIFIFDKNGNLIYNKTGFTKAGEEKEQKSIETAINTKLQ